MMNSPKHSKQPVRTLRENFEAPCACTTLFLIRQELRLRSDANKLHDSKYLGAKRDRAEAEIVEPGVLVLPCQPTEQIAFKPRRRLWSTHLCQLVRPHAKVANTPRKIMRPPAM